MNENILKAFAVLGEKMISLEKENERLKADIELMKYMEKFRRKEGTEDAGAISSPTEPV